MRSRLIVGTTISSRPEDREGIKPVAQVKAC
jgi:hypothetical protein